MILVGFQTAIYVPDKTPFMVEVLHHSTQMAPSRKDKTMVKITVGKFSTVYHIEGCVPNVADLTDHLLSFEDMEVFNKGELEAFLRFTKEADEAVEEE